ncbi:MAG: MinD/ParA family protein [Planctomycetaceae bacterium]|nr:MAG: MinD/ParA family protein [Planctomycetaceae bacterium]
MSKTISIHSFRGGTGKSNTTANLAVLLARTGSRVGVVDTDIHSPGIHVVFSRSPQSFTHSLNDYQWGRCRIEQAAYDVTSTTIGSANPDDGPGGPRIFLIPSSIKTGEIARILREGYDVSLLNDGFNELTRALALDYLLIDTHPGVNEETLLSIAISDAFVLILRPDNQDFQGTAVTVELARKLNVQKILVVLNKVPSAMDRDLLRLQVEDAYRAPVVGILPLCQEMAELASSGLFVNRFPDHPLTRELTKVAEQLRNL